jgi:C-terminal processing protease CtpA/Prc
VGSSTDGANGEEIYVRIPGGLLARFTGMEIFHHDGRPLQQVGIQPDVLVRPTLRGLRAGKDEVLDRAVRYLRTGR